MILRNINYWTWKKLVLSPFIVVGLFLLAVVFVVFETILLLYRVKNPEGTINI